MWILAHLTYPLAWVFDQYTMRQVGSADCKEEMFLRTASLVDISSSVDSIIFVVFSNLDTIDTISIGEETYPITMYTPRNNRREVPRDVVIPVVDSRRSKK